jgi:hypothetical protein
MPLFVRRVAYRITAPAWYPKGNHGINEGLASHRAARRRRKKVRTRFCPTCYLGVVFPHAALQTTNCGVPSSVYRSSSSDPSPRNASKFSSRSARPTIELQHCIQKQQAQTRSCNRIHWLALRARMNGYKTMVCTSRSSTARPSKYSLPISRTVKPLGS